MHSYIIDRSLLSDGLFARAQTDCGPVVIAVTGWEEAHFGERLPNVIASRIENARRMLLSRKTDGEWLAETVGADG